LAVDKKNKYSIRHVDSIDRLRSFDLENICDAILIDIRQGHIQNTIREIGEQQLKVALIALCKNHEQLNKYQEETYLLDDYILVDRLVPSEFSTRIHHAIHRRLKEHELLRDKTLLQSLLDNIPDAIYFKDRNSRFIKVNHAMVSIYGGKHKNILGKTDFDLFSHAQDYAQAAYNDEQNIIRSGEPIIAKLEKETVATGPDRWVSTTKLPLKDANNRIIGTMGISRNVTELKQVQESLTQERTLLRTIIDHALAGIFVKDIQGHYRMLNQQHANYLGANTEENAIGKTLYDFFDDEEAARISASDAQIMKSGIGQENMIDHRHRIDGTQLWLLTSKVPLNDDEGNCIGLVGISLDVTDQKENERKLKSTIQILEETKLQLIEAEKLKTVGRLAAGVAHEVKNPLNVVSLGIEYLESQIEEPDEIRETLVDMSKAVKKANHVIFELLDYSSPHKIRKKAIDINQLASRVLSLMRHNFNEAGITVEEQFKADLPPVRLDVPKMEQVFINIYLNAISVMQKGGHLTVRTKTTRMTSTGSNVSSAMTEIFRIGDTIVQVEVLDTGTGLSQDDERKAFDPFYSTKKTGEGTGLGLSVTRSIIEMHHGMITLKNRKNPPGACVSLLLPAVTPNTDDD
jgi:PAS domain S-box-containing protein